MCLIYTRPGPLYAYVSAILWADLDNGQDYNSANSQGPILLQQYCVLIDIQIRWRPQPILPSLI